MGKRRNSVDEWDGLTPDTRATLRGVPVVVPSREVSAIKARLSAKRKKAEEKRYQAINDAQPVKVYRIEGREG